MKNQKIITAIAQKNGAEFSSSLPIYSSSSASLPSSAANNERQIFYDTINDREESRCLSGCVQCARGCARKYDRDERGCLIILSFMCILLGLFALLITILLNTGMRSPFNWASGLMLIATIVYITMGVLVFCSTCFCPSQLLFIMSESVYVVTTFLAALVLVAAFMHLGQMTYTDAVFKLYFDDIASDPNYEQKPLDTAEAIKVVGKTGGRFVGTAALMILHMSLSCVMCVISLGSTTIFNGERILMNLSLLLAIIFSSSGFWVSSSLGWIRSRSPSLFESQFLYAIPIFLSLASVSFVLFLTIDFVSSCLSKYINIYTGIWMLVFCFFAFVAVVLEIYLPVSFDPKQTIICDPSFFYVCPEEQLASVSSSQSGLYLLDPRTNNRLNLSADPILNTAPPTSLTPVSGGGDTTPLASLTAVSAGGDTRSSSSAVVAADTDADGDAEEEEEEEEALVNVATAEDCALFARSVARYNAAMKEVEPQLQDPEDDESPLCYDYAGKVQEWVDQLGQGVKNLKVASIILSVYSVILPAVVGAVEFFILLCMAVLGGGFSK